MDTTTDRTAAGIDRARELMALATGDEKHEESSTSTFDVLWVLYDRVLRLDPGHPDRGGGGRAVHPQHRRRAGGVLRDPRGEGVLPGRVAPRVHGLGESARLAPRP